MAAPVAIVAGYLVGNPVGGHVLSILHWLAGLRQLGYDVVFVEHHGWPNACWNPRARALTDDPSYGLGELSIHAAGFIDLIDSQLFGSEE